jgi:hypothetical protein
VHAALRLRRARPALQPHRTAGQNGVRLGKAPGAQVLQHSAQRAQRLLPRSSRQPAQQLLLPCSNRQRAQRSPPCSRRHQVHHWPLCSNAQRAQAFAAMQQCTAGAALATMQPSKTAGAASLGGACQKAWRMAWEAALGGCQIPMHPLGFKRV